MGFGISVRRLPSLRSYAACATYFNRTDKPRGSTWGDFERPLDSPRQYHKRITDLGDAFALYLYKTPLVTYIETGEVEVILHASVSSRSFLSCFLPRGIDYYNHGGGHLLLQVDTPEGCKYLQVGSGTTRLKPAIAAGEWEVLTELPTRTRLQLDRKAAAEVRKLALPFVNWAQATEKLTGKRFNVWLPRSGLRAHDLEPMLKTPEHWPLLADQLYQTREQVMTTLYQRFNVRKEVPIPDTEKPRRAVTGELQYT